MILKIKKSLTNINYKLLIALLIMGLCPTIYNTVRIFWLGELPGEYSYSIAGQLSWINLIYEVLNEAIILPLLSYAHVVVLPNATLSSRVSLPRESYSYLQAERPFSKTSMILPIESYLYCMDSLNAPLVANLTVEGRFGA